MSNRLTGWRAVFGLACAFAFTGALPPLFAAEPGTEPEPPPSALETLLTHFGGDKSGSLGSDVHILPARLGSADVPHPDLETDARSAFRIFAADLHRLKGDDIFAGWKELRPADRPHPNIPKTLRGHANFQVQLQAEQLFDNRDDAGAATAAARTFFASDHIKKHAVYLLSDKDVHGGLLLAAELKDGRRIFLVFLMD